MKVLQLSGAPNKMNAKQKPALPKTAFKVVARRQKRNASDHMAVASRRPTPQFYWGNFENAGKRAGIVISLLSLCGILFAAGSKVQRVLDDLEALHKQVQKHEDRMQQNEANDSKQAVEIGYLQGRTEQQSERANHRAEKSGAGEIIEKREETVPAPRPLSQRKKKPAPSPPTAQSHAVPINDKLYTTILYYYNHARRLQPQLAGKLTVICKVDQNGSLAATEVISSSPELHELAERLAGKIRRWRFPDHVTGLESGSFYGTYFLSPEGF